MSAFPFTRLFSMPAFEGLRVLRKYCMERPEDTPAALVALIGRVEADAHSFDLEAALFLHSVVTAQAPHDGIDFYRICLADVLVLELPEWARLVTLGRGRFIKRLKAAEYRDIRSLFRQAHLLDEPPSEDNIAWWDALQSHVRSQQNQDAMRRARIAEKLTLDFEAARLSMLGIDTPPRWMAIEDNTVGYDVLSYWPGDFGPVNRLIEVKSTIASPLRFNVTRNEWDQASAFGEAFIFHIWDLKPDPPVLYERTVAQVAPHIPDDNEEGKWTNALIPVSIS
ncbi:DUF3883 domain-containing protein [Sphingomonas sp.]|uniref:DUF3883 domain-containing protein n=1 Tax=Sphingomonas sp. TaxID=28214 RepID=UPI003F702193